MPMGHARARNAAQTFRLRKKTAVFLRGILIRLFSAKHQHKLDSRTVSPEHSAASIATPAATAASNLMTCLPTFDFAPYRCSGVVYGTLLNDPKSLLALGTAVHEAPYKAAPKAPVLYLKPRNTLAASGSELSCPATSDALKIGANLGIVIARTACRVRAEDALHYIAGYTIVNDVSLPLESCYRPSIRFIARDGFCPVGPAVVRSSAIADPDALAVTVYIDDKLASRSSTSGRQRNVPALLCAVTEFMTLQAGDILLLGEAAEPPLARPGQRVAIEIEGLGRLENAVVGEDAAR